MKNARRKDNVKRIANNVFFVLIARASEFVSGFLIIILITRYLGVKDFGMYAYISSAALMLAPIIAFGSGRIMVREIAVNKDKMASFVTSGFALNITMSLVALVVAAVIAVASDLMSPVYLLALFMAVVAQTMLAMSRNVKTVFIAFERAVYNSVTTVLTRLLAVISIIAVTYYDMGLVSLFAAMLAVNAFGLIFSFSVLHFQFTKIKLALDIDLLKYLFKEAYPIAISVFCAQGFLYVNVFLLKYFHDVAQISYFQAPQRVINPLIVIFSAIIVVVSPVLARAAAKDAIDDLKYALNKMIKYTVILAIPLCLSVTFFAPQITLLLFGEQFVGATVPFQILIWITIPAFINVLLAQMLTAMKKQKILIISNGIGFLVNLALGLIFVNTYASVGVCWASLFSYIGLLAGNFYFVFKFLGRIPIHKLLVRPLIAGSIMCISFYLLMDNINVIIGIGLIILYCGLLFMFKTFTKDEIEVFKAGLSRRFGTRPERLDRK